MYSFMVFNALHFYVNIFSKRILAFKNQVSRKKPQEIRMAVYKFTFISAKQYWQKPIVLFLDAKRWVILETCSGSLALLPCFLVFLKNPYSVLFCSFITPGYQAACDAQL